MAAIDTLNTSTANLHTAVQASAAEISRLVAVIQSQPNLDPQILAAATAIDAESQALNDAVTASQTAVPPVAPPSGGVSGTPAPSNP